jgi:hypothetical protein
MEKANEYLRRRAEEERHAADQALCSKAREVHLELAARYRDAARMGGPAFVVDSGRGRDRPGLPTDFRILE